MIENTMELLSLWITQLDHLNLNVT